MFIFIFHATDALEDTLVSLPIAVSAVADTELPKREKQVAIYNFQETHLTKLIVLHEDSLEQASRYLEATTLLKLPRKDLEDWLEKYDAL